jgi:hypothetical protein
VGKDVQPLQSVKLVYQSCSRSRADRTLTWVIYGIELNLSSALHYGNYYLLWSLFNWVGIYFYLVIANNFFTNLLKVMLNLNHYLLTSLTLHMSPTVSEFMHIILHTCWAMNACDLTLAINPQVKSRYPRRRTTMTSSIRSWRHLRVNCWRQGDSYISSIYLLSTIL